MEREPDSSTAPLDYRVIAMKRASTAASELQAAGAEGFRIAVVPECTQEGMFVLHRAPVGHITASAVDTDVTTGLEVRS